MTPAHEILTDAIRYWEKRRIAYNAILTLIVVGVFLFYWPATSTSFSFDKAQEFFILAVMANVAYCAAYVVDVPAQLSDFRATWQRHRWVLFGIGVVFASILARFIATGVLLK